jgi:hypothetical protein
MHLSLVPQALLDTLLIDAARTGSRAAGFFVGALLVLDLAIRHLDEILLVLVGAFVRGRKPCRSECLRLVGAFSFEIR